MEPATVEPAAITVHATQGSLTMATMDLAALVRKQPHWTFSNIHLCLFSKYMSRTFSREQVF